MVVYQDINTMQFIGDSVVTIGTFDGVHLAHCAVLEEVARLSKDIKSKAVVITFATHPKEVTDPDAEISLLSVPGEKNVLLNRAGINTIIYMDFNLSFAKTYYFDFIKLLASKMNIRKMVVGYDHDFGKNKEGTVYNLRKISPLYNFEVVEVPKQTVDGMDVSSSVIRDAIRAGNIQLANKLLGYNYTIHASVAYRTEDYIFFHTMKTKKVIPPEGIYEVRVKDTITLMEIGKNIWIYNKNIKGEKGQSVYMQILNKIA